MTNAFFIAALLVGVALAGSPAMAGERFNDGLMGAGAGAIVGGPVGAIGGGAIGYVAGPSISHGFGSHHHYHHHYAHHY